MTSSPARAEAKTKFALLSGNLITKLCGVFKTGTGVDTVASGL